MVLDTHALIWWVSDAPQLSRVAKNAIRKTLRANERLLVSAITAWEIALLVKKQRLVLTMDVVEWIAATESIEGVQYVPIDHKLAVQSQFLPGEFHADPADRLIVALARQHNVSLITADERIQQYPQVATIW
jgi:PIN domain nuclease of toxin-antitoxin system